MATASPWPLINAERRALADDLSSLDDAQWSAGGGPEVSGPVLSLALAMTGRSGALADLSGDGLATLQARAQAAG
jgi:hypothetical protein